MIYSQVCDETGCQTEDTSFVMDPSRRGLMSVADNEQTNCRTSDGYDPVLCPDGLTCAENCAISGFTQEDYDVKWGISSEGNAITFRYLTDYTIGGGGYLLATEDKYKMFKMKNREIAFDVDMSKLPCGLNGALFFVEVEEDGGMASYPSNKAGAKYGLGVCDGQCKHDLTYYGGKVNVDGYAEEGACCFEFDLWEANAWATAYTTHGCSIQGYYLCTGTECGDGDDRYNGVCDKDGCLYNSFKLNDHFFYGANESFVIDTRRPFTVVTQFVTVDGTDSGDLNEVRRIYVQDNIVIENSFANYHGLENYNSISDDFCADLTAYIGGANYAASVGGMKGIGDALDRGVVLDFALWADSGSYMLWLDGLFPPDADPATPGALNGPCPADSGRPDDIIVDYPDAAITFSNIKYGTIGSTFRRKL
ncbi:Glycosyl Hydrolase 7 [Hyalella azteca]|uniref:cellulase n=1 Tax=Hyalella azteca TaxID=294128 RepID=A0A6A0H6V7_HYAAZ|nr:Glycosyl Hydrolase 7 [Hyalella azteca]